MEITAAPWVVPGDRPVIKEGAVVIDRDKIIDVGTQVEIGSKYPNLQENRYSSVLMPGLVNSHMHLELSHLQGISAQQADQNITDWIADILRKRAACNDLRQDIVDKFQTILEDLYRSGVVLIGDIGNDYFSELHGKPVALQPHVLRMLEFLGPNLESCQTALEKIKTLDESIIATGHAPYSTGPELLSQIKKRCNRLNHLFSIHAAESVNELEFLQTGRGCFRSFLEKRNSWDGMFTFDKKGFSGAIEYFDHLAILDDRTLLVHCVHVSDGEIMLIRDRGAHVCLCPGSNRFLGVGLPPVERMVELGLLPGLGTDSLASNSSIDIWQEMQVMAEMYPHLEYSIILAIGTLGGAGALGHKTKLGSLAVGKDANFIHVSSDLLLRCTDAGALVKELVTGGRPTKIEWVQSVH